MSWYKIAGRPARAEGHSRIMAPAKAPFGEILEASWVWLDDYLEAESLLEDIRELKGKFADLNRLRVSPELSTLKVGLATYWERRARALARLIEGAPGGDPFAALFNPALAGKVPMPPPIDEADLKAAIELLPKGDITAQKRDKELKKLRETIKSKKAKLGDLASRSQKYFMRDSASVMLDIRQVFLDHWKGLQSKVNSPCGPSGRALETCADGTRQAWARLGMGDYVNEATEWEPSGMED